MVTAREREWLGEVGMRVRLALVARGESQDRLAARSGVCRMTLGSIERGEYPATVSTYVRLTRAIDMSPDELLEGAP